MSKYIVDGKIYDEVECICRMCGSFLTESEIEHGFCGKCIADKMRKCVHIQMGWCRKAVPSQVCNPATCHWEGL